jgi:uncharacterized protein (DUF2252 family)
MNGWKRQSATLFLKDLRSGFAVIVIVGNLRPVASPEGELGIRVRDLDQTVIGQPCARSDPSGAFPRDGARGSNLPGVTMTHMLERMIEGYQSAFTPEALRVF